MRSTNIFQGVKELTGKKGTITIVDEKYQWAAFAHEGDRKYRIERFSKIPNETNKHLYQRFQYLSIGMNDWAIEQTEKYDKKCNRMNDFYRDC